MLVSKDEYVLKKKIYIVKISQRMSCAAVAYAHVSRDKTPQQEGYDKKKMCVPNFEQIKNYDIP